MALTVIGRAHPSPGEAKQMNAAPNAQVGQLRAPVPAEHIVGLTQMRIARHGGIHAPKRTHALHIGNVAVGRSQGDAQKIFFGAHKACHIVFPNAVHIVRFPKQRAVQIHLAQRVDAVEAQDEPLRVPCRFRQIEGLFKYKIPIAYSSGFPLVFARVRVSQRTGADQRVIYRTGHLAGITFFPVEHRPVFMQGNHQENHLPHSFHFAALVQTANL